MLHKGLERTIREGLEQNAGYMDRCCATEAGHLVIFDRAEGRSWEEKDLEQGVIRRWTVTGTDCRPDVETVDVGCPDEVVETLRGICEYEPVCGRPDRSSLHGRPRVTDVRDAIGQ